MASYILHNWQPKNQVIERWATRTTFSWQRHHHYAKKYVLFAGGASGSVMVSMLDLQTYTSEFESHLMSHLSKKLSKLLRAIRWCKYLWTHSAGSCSSMSETNNKTMIENLACLAENLLYPTLLLYWAVDFGEINK